MQKPTFESLATHAAAAAMDLPRIPPAPEDLPEELRPIHLRHGAWWKVGYEPLNSAVPYVARPRSGDTSNVRADTARLLDRVLTMHAQHNDDEEESPTPPGGGDTND